jgi:hypothetical protein
MNQAYLSLRGPLIQGHASARFGELTIGAGEPVECNMELSAFIVYVEWLKRKPCFTPESMEVTSQCYAIGFLFLDLSSPFCRFLVDPI